MAVEVIGFVGLGVMGGPMARTLLRAGYTVRVHDLAEPALAALAEAGATPAASGAEVAAGAGIVITMLPSGREVRAAVLGEGGVLAGLEDGALLVDMSTVVPRDTAAVAARLAERGARMLDAPVGRTAAEAEQGKLLIMVGGEPEDLERARPVLEVLGDTIVHCGGQGAGTAMKLVDSYLAVASNAVTAEALVLAEAAGLEESAVLEVLRGTAAGRGHLNTTYPAKVLAGDVAPGFSIDRAHADIQHALELCAELRVPAIFGAAARHYYQLAQAREQGSQDWTALLHTLRRRANLSPGNREDRNDPIDPVDRGAG